jgi:hypothetical protein
MNVNRLRWILGFLVGFMLWAGTWGLTYAQDTPPTPLTPPTPPEVILEPEVVPDLGPATAPTELAGLPPLKAVLIVGPIDGDNGTWTTQETANMELAAQELEAWGVTVHRFYTPENDWSSIKAAAQGAHFLLYRGHGVYWTPMPSPDVGGFALKDRFLTPDELRQGLNLAPGAIVMLYGCFTAGSSSADEGAITSQEAQRRVTQYSAPFGDIGAAGYYASWYGDAFQKLIRYLFQGKTLGQAYEAFYDFGSATVERYEIRRGSGAASDAVEMWLDKDHWWGDWQYNYAFVGWSNRTLAELFGSPELAVAPEKILCLAEPNDPSLAFELHVDSTGPATFTWQAAVSPESSWLEIQPASGTNGQEVRVIITPGGRSPGTYETSIRILADGRAVQNGETTIPVIMEVERRLHSNYLPTIMVDSP